MTTEIEISKRKAAVEEYLESKALEGFPKNLLDAINHILTLGGKRLRPIMVLTVASGYDVPEERAMPPAAAIELFHNFTLVHDDILDKADLRRGKITVHQKFGADMAIVAGDAMLLNAVNFLRKGNEKYTNDLLDLFEKMGVNVMEGQEYDMEFETREEISLEEYLKMIGLKTSVLFGTACEIGGIIGNASMADRKHLYDFGFYSGLAFQIMDDYLDTFGDSTFGKKIGGDILLNKKTFLLVSAMQNSTNEQRSIIERLFNEQNEEVKIREFQVLFREMNIPEITYKKMDDLHDRALQSIEKTSLPASKKQEIISLSKSILARNS